MNERKSKKSMSKRDISVGVSKVKSSSKQYNNTRDQNYSQQQRRSSRMVNERLSFSDIVLKKCGLTNSKGVATVEVLAQLPYEKEIEIKNISIQEWWKDNIQEYAIEAIVPSPLPRGYRTTTKRKVSVSGNKIFFTHGDGRVYLDNVVTSLLDPLTHNELYKFIHQLVSDRRNALFALALNYIIFRQVDEDIACIFNIAEINAEVVRAGKFICEKLKTAKPEIKSVFLFHDPSRSNYYLEQDFGDNNGVRIKKMYGYDMLRMEYNGTKTLISPFGFMQVNMPTAKKMIESITEYCNLTNTSRLLDLYCGYGLFSFYVGKNAREVIGIDVEGYSIECAKRNSQSLEKGKFKFYSRSITSEMLENVLPRPVQNEYVILDPPRSGVSDEIITSIADRAPQKVVHIFCNIEEIPRSLITWKECGYKAVQCIPYDMFAGTPNCEVVVFLEKSTSD